MKLMNILKVNNGEKEIISSFFNHVFSQSEGPAEGAILQKLTFELTDQINDNSITGFKLIYDNHDRLSLTGVSRKY